MKHLLIKSSLYSTLENFNEILRNSKLSINLDSMLHIRDRQFDYKSLEAHFQKCSIFDYKSMIASGTLVFLLSCGRTNVYELELESSMKSFHLHNNKGVLSDQLKWRPLDTSSISIELPKDTLVLAEKVVEYCGMVINIFKFSLSNKTLTFFLLKIDEKSPKKLCYSSH
jgi:hypothetical protein